MPRVMRLVLILCVFACLRAEDARRPATSEEKALFETAMKNTAQETERWAYTETTAVKVNKGRERGETIVQFDPSKPYAEQFTPIKVKGKEPSKKNIKQYRERGEKRGVKVARAAETARGNPQVESTGPTLRVGKNRVKLDREHPLVVEDDAESITYQLLMSSEEQLEIPIDKFELRIRVLKQRQFVENVRLRLLESFRVKLIAKLKAGEASVEFGVVDPQHGPVVTRMTGNFDFSVLFMSGNGVFTNTRTEYRRVKPYDERFEVKLGPLKTLDF